MYEPQKNHFNYERLHLFSKNKYLLNLGVKPVQMPKLKITLKANFLP